MEYMKKQIPTYRAGQVITDQFYIDDDYNVPDVKSDAHHSRRGFSYGRGYDGGRELYPCDREDAF